jgi:GNAT superfamily N-acetyltransferase
MSTDLRTELVRADDPRALALLADYESELEDEGIVLHHDEGGGVTVPEMVPPRGAFHLVVVDGEPAACGGVRTLGDGVAEVKRMYVAPRARNRGVARAPLALLESEAAGLGCHAVRLDTGPDMTRALALYLSSGYHRIEDYNGNPHAGHWLEKPLRPDVSAARP